MENDPIILSDSECDDGDSTLITSRSASGYKGVYSVKGKGWTAWAKNRYVGLFDNKVAAARAVAQAGGRVTVKASTRPAPPADKAGPAYRPDGANRVRGLPQGVYKLNGSKRYFVLFKVAGKTVNYESFESVTLASIKANKVFKKLHPLAWLQSHISSDIPVDQGQHSHHLHEPSCWLRHPHPFGPTAPRR